MKRFLLIVALALAAIVQAAPQELGNVADDSTVIFSWNTFDDDGASVTRATDGTVKVLRLVDDTDCTAGVVTDSEDDPLTGIHKCTLDLSGSANCIADRDYIVYVEGMVVDGDTINAVLARFSIQKRYDVASSVTAGVTLADDAITNAKFDETTAFPITGAALNGTNANTLSGHDPGEAIMGTSDLGTGAGLTSLAPSATALDNTVWTNAKAAFLTGDAYVRLGAPAGASIAADIADIPTNAELNLRTLPTASYFDPAADTVAHVTLCDTTTTNTDMRGTDNAALAATALSTAQWTAARAGYLDELAAANLPADVDAILADTAVIGAAGAGLTAIPWNAAWTASTAGAVWNALTATYGTAGTYGALVETTLDGTITSRPTAAQVQAAVTAALTAFPVARPADVIIINR